MPHQPSAELEALALLIMERGWTGLSLVYARLDEEGAENPAEAGELMFGLERRGWVEVSRFVDQGEYRPATRKYRQDVIAEHGTIKPRWDPDVDYGDLNLQFRVTDDGKAEYLRQAGPTPDEDAWKTEGGNGEIGVWAPTERIARRVVRESIRILHRPPEGARIAFRKINLDPDTFELATGERFEGVCVTYKLRLVAVADRGRV